MNLSEYADVCGTDKGTYQGFMQYYPNYLPDPKRLVNLVELGVLHGSSLTMWRNYFENRWSSIVGIDVDISQAPVQYAALWQGHQIHTLKHVNMDALVFQGDQADRDLAAAVHNYTGDLDIVIDDASHYSSKTIASFETWWPYIQPGGVYVVEDTHCSYNVDHYGERESAPPVELPSPRTPRYARISVATTMEYLKRLADDVNWNYHGYDRFNPIHEDVAYVHFYPGITFIGKVA